MVVGPRTVRLPRDQAGYRLQMDFAPEHARSQGGAALEVQER